MAGEGGWWTCSPTERATALRFYANRSDECAGYCRRQTSPWSSRNGDFYARQACRLRALADLVERTQNTTAQLD